MVKLNQVIKSMSIMRNQTVLHEKDNQKNTCSVIISLKLFLHVQASK